MIIYPAIDLKDQKCVRLYKGDMQKVTIFNDSPVNQAQYFADNDVMLSFDELNDIGEHITEQVDHTMENFM